MDKGLFLGPDDGRSFKRANEMVIKVKSSETNGTYELCLETCPPGFESPRHKHTKDFETFYVLEGTAIWEVGGEVVEAGAGTTIHIPPDVPHKVTTPEGCKMLIVYGPGEQEGQLAELTALTPEQQKDDALKRAIFAKYNRVNVG
jgi:quercetin dioxygenase-like cupin family protein